KKMVLAEGEWRLIARVPRHDGELCEVKEHASEPAALRVGGRPLRVLLFADTASREFQFVRTFLQEEANRGRFDVHILLQSSKETGANDVSSRSLSKFPERLEEKARDDRPDNLASFDLILAIDPDWSRLSGNQFALLQRWVERQGGGLVYSAGSSHTGTLARPGRGEKFKLLLDLLPVVLEDDRLAERDASTPFPLRVAG